MKRGLKQKIDQYEAAQAAKDAKKNPEKWKQYTLTSKVPQTPNITSFTFSKSNTTDAGDELEPGLFARLKLPNGLVRSYSIVSGDTNKFQLGIKREDSGRGGSKYLHDELKEGDTISVGKMTEGVPIPEQSSNHIFIAGGIGITAFLMHADVYSQIGFNYTLHFAVASEEDIPFKDELRKLGSKDVGKVVVYDKSKGERMDIHKILKERVWNSFVYTCGPQRMIDGVVSAAAELGMAKEEVHYEAFQIETSGDPFTVEVKGIGKMLDVPGEKTLLQVLREAGIEVDSSCEMGNCGTCKVTVCGGKVEHRGSGLPEEEKEGAMLSCVSRGAGHLVIELE